MVATRKDENRKNMAGTWQVKTERKQSIETVDTIEQNMTRIKCEGMGDLSIKGTRATPTPDTGQANITESKMIRIRHICDAGHKNC